MILSSTNPAHVLMYRGLFTREEAEMHFAAAKEIGRRAIFADPSKYVDADDVMPLQRAYFERVIAEKEAQIHDESWRRALREYIAEIAKERP